MAVPVVELVAPLEHGLPLVTHRAPVQAGARGERVLLFQGHVGLFLYRLFLRQGFPHAAVVGHELLCPHGQRRVHVPPGSVPGHPFVHPVRQLVDEPSAGLEAQHQHAFGHRGVPFRLQGAVGLEEPGGPAQVPGAVHRVADPAHSFRGADLHGPFGHVLGGPELVLVAVRVGKVDDGPFVAARGRPHRVGVRDAVAVQPPEMGVHVLGPHVETAPRRVLAQGLGRRIDLGLEERADAAGLAVPPEEAHDRHVLLAPGSGDAPDGPSRDTGGVHRPIHPCHHVVGADDEVVDPVDDSARLMVRHGSPPCADEPRLGAPRRVRLCQSSRVLLCEFCFCRRDCDYQSGPTVSTIPEPPPAPSFPPTPIAPPRGSIHCHKPTPPRYSRRRPPPSFPRKRESTCPEGPARGGG